MISREAAVSVIMQAVRNYDDGYITFDTVEGIVLDTLNLVHEGGYDLGLAVADEERNEDEIEFEADVDLFTDEDEDIEY